MSGGTNFVPTAIEFIGENLVRGDSRGYTFLHDDNTYVDPQVDVSATPDAWLSDTIIYDYISVGTDFGTSYARKWVPSVSVVCKNDTNLSLQVRSINDDGRRTGDLKPIRFRGNVVWGEADIYWGDPDVIWNYQGLIDETRRMPSQHLRCEYKQIQLTNAQVAIVSSDTIGEVIVSNSASTAILIDAASFSWPSSSVDYYIAFETDDYTKEYLVTARTDDTLTFSDSDSTAPDIATSKWVLRGTPKGEVLHLISYTINYAIFGQTQQAYRSGNTGEVDG
jgi:hypothetical protein